MSDKSGAEWTDELQWRAIRRELREMSIGSFKRDDKDEMEKTYHLVNSVSLDTEDE